MGKPNFSEDFKRDAVHPLNVFFCIIEAWRYSNSGYILLSSVIEEITGQSGDGDRGDGQRQDHQQSRKG